MRHALMIGKIRGLVPQRRQAELRRALVGVALMSGLAACSGAPQTVARAPLQPATPVFHSGNASYVPPGPPTDPWGP
jgi:hypothetical protein